MLNKDISAIQWILLTIAVLAFGFSGCFGFLTWVQETQKTTQQPIQSQKETPEPRFRCEQFDLGDFKFIYEVKDTKNKVTYIIFRDFKGTVLLSKEPTSATNATLLEELK